MHDPCILKILKPFFLINDSSEFTTMYHHSLRQDVFIKEEYHYLNVPKVGTFTVYDSLDCTFECLGNPSCLSFNLAAYKGADGKLRCELLSSEKYSSPEEYKRNESFITVPSRWGKIFAESLLK